MNESTYLIAELIKHLSIRTVFLQRIHKTRSRVKGKEEIGNEYRGGGGGNYCSGKMSLIWHFMFCHVIGINASYYLHSVVIPLLDTHT